jgi:glyoxylase-like metal-dependent hydrolase (beta-lactamase superfamily II)
MLYLKSFCFNPFQQNTYLVYTDKGNAWIIDPGNYTASENQELKSFVAEKNLRLTRLLLTHAHIDHVLGNRFVFETYGLLPEMHKDDLFFIDRMMQSAAMYGIACEASPNPKHFISEGETLMLDDYKFEVIHTPGHSPGSISFYNQENKLLIAGDVLFRGSIGRSDLPMGNHETLIRSITEKLLVLGDDVKVYNGHGPATTTGFEKLNNPFLTDAG